MNEVVSFSNNDQIRPQASSSTNNGAPLSLRPNSSQSTSFIGQFMQNGVQNGGNQRHAISPICCEVSSGSPSLNSLPHMLPYPPFMFFAQNFQNLLTRCPFRPCSPPKTQWRPVTSSSIALLLPLSYPTLPASISVAITPCK